MFVYLTQILLINLLVVFIILFYLWNYIKVDLKGLQNIKVNYLDC